MTFSINYNFRIVEVYSRRLQCKFFFFIVNISVTLKVNILVCLIIKGSGGPQSSFQPDQNCFGSIVPIPLTDGMAEFLTNNEKLFSITRRTLTC